MLGVIAAVMALSGKKQVDQAAPPTPEQTIGSVKADVAEIRRVHSDDPAAPRRAHRFQP
ncbi:hypothetical protein GCM10027074_74430 [Streptomyces deserti]